MSNDINLEEGKSSDDSRKKMMIFNQAEFKKLIINEMSSTSGGARFLKSYTQSEVRDIVENFRRPENQKKLQEISMTLYAKSPQYRRLLKYFSGMALFSHIISPVKDIRKYNENRILKQYTDIGELLKLMNLRHEMTKVLNSAFIKDVFYGYIHRTSKNFYIQEINTNICKITSIEDGVFNFSIDMSYFNTDERRLVGWADEIVNKYNMWKLMRENNTRLSEWVELDAENTICIKINSEMIEIFPPFAGSFDSIFDIEGFKELRKNREEIQNYMIITQELPLREDSEQNNDFMIDKEFMMFFHNMASDTVPENVGVITSPMKIEALRFDKDRVDSDGVAKATRDFWEGSGTSQLLFNSDKSTSEGLRSGIKTDEEIVFDVLTQIERWVNRYLKLNFKDLFFNVSILHLTHFNRQEMFKMYIEAGQYGLPVKNHISAVVGLSPIETMNMAYLENDLLEMHEEFIPLKSSHTMSGKDLEEGRPEKDDDDKADETIREEDKPNA